MRKILLILVFIVPFHLTFAQEDRDFWYQQGQAVVEKNQLLLEQMRNQNRDASGPIAKNIILFIGDGMGISTVTAARIYEGQLRGENGEENSLYFETFPNVALSKTYNTNRQTPDSAGTMTAMMTGVKTESRIIGLDQTVILGDCASQPGTSLRTALEMAELKGMSTGIVTTARITHATPASTYAHIMHRDFENDSNASMFPKAGNCLDIAQQLIDFPQLLPGTDGLEVALGGGRQGFIENKRRADPENGGRGARLDGRDLTQEWLDKYERSAYVWNSAQFNDIDVNEVDHLLGLFEMSHMEYEFDRATDTGGEPALHEMTEKAIQLLSKNEKGFFLNVEAGRIDHAHHATNPKRALLDTIELAKAVKKAYEMTDPNETLIIVTADHSHTMTIAGYPGRGNPILGKVTVNDIDGNPTDVLALADDNLPYTTIGYRTGHGFELLPDKNTADAIYRESVNTKGRADLTNVDTEHEGFHSETMVPLASGTHSAEDVAIYAIGPGSELIRGVMEQNVIFHVMNKAGQLSETWSE